MNAREGKEDEKKNSKKIENSLASNLKECLFPGQAGTMETGVKDYYHASLPVA